MDSHGFFIDLFTAFILYYRQKISRKEKTFHKLINKKQKKGVRSCFMNQSKN